MSDLSDLDETEVGSCDYCDDGWAEHAPIPTPHGPHYRFSQCDACGGSGRVEITMHPITMDDLDEMCGVDNG